MNFALIVDECKVSSYIVRDKKAYRFKEPTVPYVFHHSIKNEAFIGFWGYPFLWDGCFINWSEFYPALPDIDLDVIFVIIEKDFNKYRISDLRQKYPNATIFAALKETYNWMQTYQQRVAVYNECDKVLIPVSNFNLFPELSQVVKKMYFLPQPVNTSFLYNHYYTEERNEQIFSYFPVHNQSRWGETQQFTEYISRRYNIPFIRTHTQDSKQQWKDFLEYWTPCTFHFNLDPTSQYPGQQAMQCAALGVVHMGGVNDSHPLLWPDTATNDKEKLEKLFVLYTTDYEKRFEVIRNAWKKVNEIYSYEAVKYRFEEEIL